MKSSDILFGAGITFNIPVLGSRFINRGRGRWAGERAAGSEREKEQASRDLGGGEGGRGSRRTADSRDFLTSTN